MKKLPVFSLLTAAIMIAACNGNTNDATTGDTTNTTEIQSDSPAALTSDSNTTTSGNTTVDQDGQDFVKEAATGGMMEVELGKVVVQKAASQDVKDFGQRMIDDHSKANDELKQIAQGKNIAVPATVTDEQRNHMNDLQEKSGSDFDKAYIKMMLDDHKEDISAFEKAAKDLTDPDLKNFAIKTLPVLQKHLGLIEDINKKMK